MKKVQFTAAFWTLLIAIPFTALALMASAYISDHLIKISTTLALLSRSLMVKGRDLILEAEVSGMVAGILLVATIAAITYALSPRNHNRKSENGNSL